MSQYQYEKNEEDFHKKRKRQLLNDQRNKDLRQSGNGKTNSVNKE